MSIKPVAPWAVLSICSLQRFSCQNSSTVKSLRYFSMSSTEVKDPLHGSYHWYSERIVAACTMVAVGSMVFLPSTSQIVDASLMLLLPIHTYQGFSAVILDYLPKRKFGLIYTISKGALITVSTIAMYGLYKFNTENIGISAGIRKLWHETKTVE